MWMRVVTTLALVLISVWGVEWLLSRAGGGETATRGVIRQDAAPVIGFVGAVILLLSLFQALQGAVIAAWGWGIVLGLAMSLYAALIFGRMLPARIEERGVRTAWSRLRSYGGVALLAALGVYVAVRVVGAALEVFLASVLGALLLAMAIAELIGRRKRTTL